MTDSNKTKKQPVDELKELRRQVAGLRRGSVPSGETSETDVKWAEDPLWRSEERYCMYYDLSRDGIATANLNGTIMECNQAYADMLGYSHEELKKIKYQDITPSRWLAFNEKVFQEVMERGYSDVFEKEYVRKDGTVFPVSLHTWRIDDEDGNPVGVGSIVRDIADRKQAEAKLREKSEFNFALFEHNPIETIVVDLEGRITDFNLAKKKSGDRLPEIGDVMYKDYASRHEIYMYTELMKCIKTNKVKKFHDLKYGNKILSITISPFPKGAIITSIDITERKKFEIALEKRGKELNGLYNWEKLTKKVKDIKKVCHRFIKDIAHASMQFPEKVIVRIKLDDEKYFSEGKSENDMITSLSAPIMVKKEKRGRLTIGYVEDLPFIPEFEQKLINGYAGLIGEFIEKIESEEALRKSEEHYKNIIENIIKLVPEGLLVFSNQLNIFKKNKAIQDMASNYAKKLNYTEEELTEIIVEQVKSRIVSGDHSEIRITRKKG